MALTADTLWLNSFFAGYDRAVLGFAHRMADLAGSVLTPFTRFFSLLGEKGLFFLLLALILLLFPRWRRTGVCLILSVGIGAMITNLFLKHAVARPRPFEDVDLYRQWWQAAGAVAETGFSFPSGHVTATAAAMTSFCLLRGRRWSLPAVILVLLMMFSRNYLMVHYPSDVLFAALIGVFSGFTAALLTKLLFRFLESRDGEGQLYDFLLYSGLSDLSDLRYRKNGVRVSMKRPSMKSASHAAEPSDEEAVPVSDENETAAALASSEEAASSAQGGRHAARTAARVSSGYVGKH